MLLIEEHPRIPIVAKYVDRYQLFIIEKPAFFKTIPNGKIECYLIKKGEFTKWDIESNSLTKSDRSGILPATNQTSIYCIPSNLICLNIKLNLTVLSLPLFEGVLTSPKNFGMEQFISGPEQKKILSRIVYKNPKIDVAALDAIIEHSVKGKSVDKKIVEVMQLIEDGATKSLKVTDLARDINMSEKTMERWIRKQFNLTPKELLQVIRFEKVSKQLKTQPNKRLADSLEFGYYDQSHFIKECRKITGYPPKEFVAKMKLSTNDIVFE
ncbi:MAG: helix-turn-helix domain-containing protein [Cyclobacteriaceae bacterium]